MTLQPWVFVLATVAAYRVAYLVVRDEGPFSLFARIRGRIDANQRTWIGRGLNCLICVSFWMTLIVALLLQASLLEWLAMAGAIVMWREVMNR